MLIFVKNKRLEKMDKYRVHIRLKNGCLFNVNEVKKSLKKPKSSRWYCSGVRSFDNGCEVAECLNYATEQEDLAMEVYARAKRNLDAKRYFVSMYIPQGDVPKEERKAVHLGSC